MTPFTRSVLAISIRHVHSAQYVCIGLFWVALITVSAIHETVRSQLVSQLGGEQQFSWRDFRSAGDWFGQGGMWMLHKQYYPESRLRFWFAASLSAMVLAAALGAVLQAYGVR